MREKISEKELLEEIIKIAMLLKERSEKEDEKDSTIVNLSIIKPEIYSLFMQKLADMTKEEITELITGVYFKFRNIKIIKSVNRSINEEGFSYDTYLSKLIADMILETFMSDENEDIEDIYVPEDLEAEYIGATIKKLVRTIQEIKPEYYPIYYGDITYSGITDFIISRFSKPINRSNFSISHPLFSLMLKDEKIRKYTPEIRQHYGYMYSKPLFYELIRIGIFVQLMFDFLIFSFKKKISEILLTGDKEKAANNFEKLIKSLSEVYIDFILDRNISLTSKEFGEFLVEARKFLEKNYDELFELVEYLEDDYTVELINFNRTVTEIKYKNKEGDEIFKFVSIYGLENIKKEELVLSFDSSLLYSFLDYALKNSGDKEFYRLLEFTEYIINNMPYISKNYDYQHLDEIIDSIAFDEKGLDPYYAHMYLKYLYKTEQYEEFVEYFDKFQDDLEEYMFLYKLFALYFAGKVIKEDLIEVLERLIKEDNYFHGNMLVPILSSLKNEGNLSKIIDNSVEHEEDVLDLIDLYPYEPEFYKKLNIKFEYEPKQLRL